MYIVLKIESLVYNGSINTITKNTISVKYGYLLVKTLYVYIGLVEKIVLNNYEPIIKPIIMGSSGIVKIIEDPSGLTSELSGKTAVVSPFGLQGILGLDQDGLASNYTQLHTSYIYKYVTEAKPYYTIYPYIAHSLKLCKEAENPVLIIGCNIVSISSALYLTHIGLDKPDLICSRIPSFLKNYDLKILQHVSDLLPKYNTVIVSYEKYSLIHDVLRNIIYNNIVLTSLSRVRNIPIKAGLNARINYIDSVDYIDDGSINEILRIISKDIKIIRVKSLSESIGLLPPRKFGLIIELTG